MVKLKDFVEFVLGTAMFGVVVGSVIAVFAPKEDSTLKICYSIGFIIGAIISAVLVFK